MTDLEDRQTHSGRALQVWHELHVQLDTLKILERDLKRRPDQGVYERTRPDKVADAIEHLEQAMSALYVAGQE